jgi:hypothetical protein
MSATSPTFGAHKAGWAHSNDGDGKAFDQNRLPDDLWIATEFSSPVSIGDDGDARRASPIVFRGEEATPGGLKT